jgi:hypothetical protein
MSNLRFVGLDVHAERTLRFCLPGGRNGAWAEGLRRQPSRRRAASARPRGAWAARATFEARKGSATRSAAMDRRNMTDLVQGTTVREGDDASSRQ